MRVLVAEEAAFEGRPEVMQRLLDIVNEAYDFGEGDLFRDGFARATADEVLALAAAKQLLLVVTDTAKETQGEAQGEESKAGVEAEPKADGLEGSEETKATAAASKPASLTAEEPPTDGDRATFWANAVTPQSLVGCMKLVLHEPTSTPTADAHKSKAEGEAESFSSLRIGEVGMFAVRKDLRSQGIGRLVFDAAEARARSLNCDVCELQLLYPQDRPHAVKDRLRVWYTSRGYRVVSSKDFAKAYPRVASLINGRVCFDIYHKPLRPENSA